MTHPPRALLAVLPLAWALGCGEGTTSSGDSPDAAALADAAHLADLDAAAPSPDASLPADLDASSASADAEAPADGSAGEADAAAALDAEVLVPEDAGAPDAAAGPDAASAGLDASAGPDAARPAYDTPAYAAASDDTAAFQSLLEAASIGPASNSAITAAVAGDFCGGAEKELAAFKEAHSFLIVLRGPTPHAVAASDLDSNGGWRAAAAADFDGDGKDEVMALRHPTASGVADVVLVDFSAACVPSVLASATVGGAGNSLWVGAGAGDVDGDGAPEAVALKPTHSMFVVFGYQNGAITTERAFDHGDATHPWAALAVADLDGDQQAEIAAARQASDGSDTVFTFRLGASTVTEVASAAIGAAGSSHWLAATAGDFNGDGQRALALVRSDAPGFVLLGGASLTKLKEAALDSDAAQPWSALTATDWLGGDSGTDELIATRQPAGSFDVGVLVYGNDWHDLRRRAALAHTRSQYDNSPAFFSASASPDVAKLEQWMSDTHANTYNAMLWDQTGKAYLDLVEVLEATRGFAVDGRVVRFWVTLIPRTESVVSGTYGVKCSVPADSPLTAWDERTLFDASLGNGGCLDFVGWGEALGRLAQQYPQLVAVNVDDFSHNVGYGADLIRPDDLAAMTAAMRTPAPWLALSPTFYYRQSGSFVLDLWPDVGLALDSILFYFRNEKQGAGPCADAAACGVPNPTSCSGACLAGTCAEATVANAPGEIADLAAGLPGARRLQVGVYATGHSACGQPSAAYDADLLETALTDPRVEGTTVYTFQHPAGACSSPTTDRGCAVQAVYGAYP